MKYILLLEPKQHEAHELAEQIESAGSYQVSLAKNMREALKHLAVRPHDLALIPVTRNDSLVYSLRFLQPNLAIYLLTAEAAQKVPARQLEAVLGSVSKKAVIERLEELLAEGEKIPEPPKIRPRKRKKKALLGKSQRPNKDTPPAPPSTPNLQASLDLDRLTLIVQNTMMDGFLQVVVATRENEVIGYHSEADEAQIMAVAQQARQSWDQNERTSQIQILEQGDEEKNLLLFTQKMMDSYLLTLGAHTHASLNKLRLKAEQIVEQMSDEALDLAIELQKAKMKHEELVRNNTYALIWRPQQLMTPIHQETLMQFLPEIAKLNGCVLRHLIIKENFVHFVCTCPPSRTTAWIAQIFKAQSERMLADQFIVESPYWASGYYGREAMEPLNKAELELFLNRSVYSSTPLGTSQGTAAHIEA